jgi:predicted RNase H-like HicB family nuclease
MSPITTRFTAQLRYDLTEVVWYAQVGEEPRVHTFGRSLRSAVDHLRDAASLWFELDVADIELIPEPIVPSDRPSRMGPWQ